MCDGNLIWMTGHMENHITGGRGDLGVNYYNGRGMSLAVGTAGELAGGECPQEVLFRCFGQDCQR